MVGREGYLLVANRRMHSILQSGDGLLLRDNRLGARGNCGREIKAWLRDASAASAARNQLAVPRPSGLRPYWVTMTPIPSAGAIPFGGAQPLATITAVDPESRAIPDAAAMTAVFGLTPAECRFARLLAGDRTMQETAEELGISPHTAKTHLKRILSKTGARRQSEMISVLLSIGGPEEDGGSRRA
jgi:DNA-binding CsgD family transcriptional regulator